MTGDLLYHLTEHMLFLSTANERQRHRRMGGGGMTRGDTTNSHGGQDVSASEKNRGTTRGGGAMRSGKVEAPLDRRRWHDKKLRRQGQEATQQPAGAD
jgi:hypothetical protein